MMPQNDGKVLWDVVQENMKRLSCREIVLSLKYPVDQGFAFDELKVPWISGTEKLDNNLDQLLACELRPGQGFQHSPSMLGKERPALADPVPIRAFQFEPVIGIEFLKSCWSADYTTRSCRATNTWSGGMASETACTASARRCQCRSLEQILAKGHPTALHSWESRPEPGPRPR